MEFDPNAAPATDIAEPSARKPLVLLRDAERSLRRQTVTALVPIVPPTLAIALGERSLVADEWLDKLAEIDLNEITDVDLRPARIQMGLTFVGFGALAMVFLLLYLYTLQNLSPVAQIQRYWFQYVLFVCLGVAGMFMLGREAMRR